MSRLTDSRLAVVGAGTLQTAYVTLHDQFQAITTQAKRRFETQDWAGMQDDAAARLGLYRRIVALAEAALRDLSLIHICSTPATSAMAIPHLSSSSGRKS